MRSPITIAYSRRTWWAMAASMSKPAGVDPVEQQPDQPGGGVEVGDGAAAHGPDGHDVAWRAADHGVGLVAHGQDGAAVLVDGDHGRLVEAHAPAPDVDQGVGGAQVDGEVPGHGYMGLERRRVRTWRRATATTTSMASPAAAPRRTWWRRTWTPPTSTPAGTWRPASANASALERVGAQPADRRRALSSTQGCTW